MNSRPLEFVSGANSRPVALVTGANRGLGLETCRQLAGRGFLVLLTSRSDSGAKVAGDLQRGGLAVAHRRLDVASAPSVASLAASLAREGTRVSLLVNNAAVSLRGFDGNVARRTLETNFFGAEQVTDALLPLTPTGGRIVMVSSALGEVACLGAALRARFLDLTLDRDGLRTLVGSFVEDVDHGRHIEVGWPSSAYSVSKVALNALARVLARDLGPRGIVVNAVSPGWVRTDMGGASAPRSVEQGAASIVRAAVEGASGAFFYDGKERGW